MLSIIEDNLEIIKSFRPEMYQALVLFWGEKEFMPYVNGLIERDRLERKGFSLSIASALLELESEHSRWFPELK
jgi:hypothetical protein